jgi:hypothetical protein
LLFVQFKPQAEVVGAVSHKYVSKYSLAPVITSFLILNQPINIRQRPFSSKKDTTRKEMLMKGPPYSTISGTGCPSQKAIDKSPAGASRTTS